MGQYLRLQVTNAMAVTPYDGQDIILDYMEGYVGCVLYIGTGGDLHVLTYGGQDVTFANIPNGTTLPVIIRQVFADTTAQDILALW
jgi:hypothetical protein